jgi:DNA-binding NtrC family response regulator
MAFSPERTVPVGFLTQQTILLIEDDATVMEYMRCILKRYILIEATTAGQALQVFNECGWNVDLLVANLTIAARSGIEVALALRLERPRLPVIITSGFSASVWNKRNTAAFRRLGPESVAILEKPIQAQALFDTVWELLGASRTEKTLTA